MARQLGDPVPLNPECQSGHVACHLVGMQRACMRRAAHLDAGHCPVQTRRRYRTVARSDDDWVAPRRLLHLRDETGMGGQDREGWSAVVRAAECRAVWGMLHLLRRRALLPSRQSGELTNERAQPHAAPPAPPSLLAWPPCVRRARSAACSPQAVIAATQSMLEDERSDDVGHHRSSGTA